VIVVNFTGVPKSMPWLDSVSAVLQAWFPGMEAGNSVADVLFGAVNPGGKLPVTMPKTFEDTPCYGNFPGELDKLEVRYEENLDIGYRFYDKEPSKALFPFGFGLSYTSFDVALVDAEPMAFQHGKDVRVRVKIKNTGRLAGSEVLQAYFAPPQGSVKRPLKTLGGFAKVTLEPGEEKVIEVKVDPEAAAYWDEDSSNWRIAKGTYQILVGNSATTIFGQQSLEVAEDITYNA
jgi:beta-glucosidase